jgi:hypothetical protein
MMFLYKVLGMTTLERGGTLAPQARTTRRDEQLGIRGVRERAQYLAPNP